MAEKKKNPGFLGIIKEKIRKKKIEKKEKESGMPSWVTNMKEGSDKEKAIRVRKELMKRKKLKDKQKLKNKNKNKN